MNCADCGELLKEREEKTWCWDCGGHMHVECSMLDPNTGDPRCELCHTAQAAKDEALGKACDQLELDLARGKRLLGAGVEQFEAMLAATDADPDPDRPHDVPREYTDAECPDLN